MGPVTESSTASKRTYILSLTCSGISASDRLVHGTILSATHVTTFYYVGSCQRATSTRLSPLPASIAPALLLSLIRHSTSSLSAPLTCCAALYFTGFTCFNDFVGRLSAASLWTVDLTLWRLLLPYGYSYKASVPDRVKPSFVIFDWASECPDVKNYKWRLNPVRQRCFIAVPIWQQWALKGTTEP